MEHRNHDVTYYNMLKQHATPQEKFDAVVLNYCFLNLRALAKPRFTAIKQQLSWVLELGCPIVAIAQDDGTRHGLLEDWIIEWDMPIVFSTIWRQGGPLYQRASNGRKMYDCFPGYIDPATISPRLSHGERQFDIAYRARKLPLLYGSAGQLKYEIGDKVQAQGAGLRLNIETNLSRGLLGNQWLDFLADTRCVLGAEGGYTALDYYGEAHDAVARHIKRNPAITISELRRLMPVGWDDHWLYTSTPRHFEAATTKTAQILLRGEYKGVFRDKENCLMIDRNYDNLDAILDVVRNDNGQIEAIAEQAYQDIVVSEKYTYKVFATQIEEAIKELKS
jgi:hypothetical protein